MPNEPQTLDGWDLWSAEPRPALAPPRRCAHPRQYRRGGEDGTVYCGRCSKVFDPAVSRRGRTNRSRGNAIEREVAARLGLARVGQYGGPDDVRGLAFAGQVKSGGSFPERIWRWLRAVPVQAGQTPIVVITDAPGPGHKRRGVVVVDLEDWIALHGPVL
jgi:hypothetical protein